MNKHEKIKKILMSKHDTLDNGMNVINCDDGSLDDAIKEIIKALDNAIKIRPIREAVSVEFNRESYDRMR